MKQIVQRTILAAVIAALPAVAMAAESKGKPAAQKPADTKVQTSTGSQAKPCAEYGEGYVKLEGTSTCVKVSGYVRFQAGRAR